MDPENWVSDWELRVTGLVQHLAELCLDEGDTAQAVEVAHRGAQIAPTHAGVVATLMRAHAARGDHHSIRRVYEAHAKALADLDLDEPAQSPRTSTCSSVSLHGTSPEERDVRQLGTVSGRRIVKEGRMDAESLTLGAIVSGLIAKALDEAGNRVVSSAADALTRLRDRLRRRFTDEQDSDALEALERLEDAPDAPSRVTALSHAVDRHVRDEGFRAELEGLVDAVKRRGPGAVIVQNQPINSPSIGSARDVHLVYGSVANKPTCACGREARVVCTKCHMDLCRQHVEEPLDVPEDLADLERRYWAAGLDAGTYSDDHLPSREQAVFAQAFFGQRHAGVVICRVCRLKAANEALQKLPPRPPLPTGSDPGEVRARLEDPSLLRYYSTRELNAARQRYAGVKPSRRALSAEQREKIAVSLAEARAAVMELQGSAANDDHHTHREGSVEFGATYKVGRRRSRLTGWTDGHSIAVPRQGPAKVLLNGTFVPLEACVDDPDAKGIFETITQDIKRYLDRVESDRRNHRAGGT